MTAKQRAQVVELLRCAADLAIGGVDVGNAVMNAGPDMEHWSVSLDAESSVCGTAPRVDRKRYLWLLEAAARVEEGWEP